MSGIKHHMEQMWMVVEARLLLCAANVLRVLHRKFGDSCM